MKHTTFKPRYECHYRSIPQEFEIMVQKYEVHVGGGEIRLVDSPISQKKITTHYYYIGVLKGKGFLWNHWVKKYLSNAWWLA